MGGGSCQGMDGWATGIERLREGRPAVVISVVIRVSDMRILMGKAMVGGRSEQEEKGEQRWGGRCGGFISKRWRELCLKGVPGGAKCWTPSLERGFKVL